MEIFTLEKDQIPGRLCGSILFESKVNAVFPGNFLKRLDVAVRDFDVADPSPLPDKVFHTLFALVDLGIFLLFLHFLKGFQECGFQHIGGQLGGFDANRHRFVFNFFLQTSSLLSLAGMLKKEMV